MKGFIRISLALFASIINVTTNASNLFAEDLDSLELPEVVIPNTPPQSAADTCRAIAQYTYDGCITRGENPFVCTEAYRKTVQVTCFCLDDANKAAPMCQTSGQGPCLQEFARCQIEEDVRYNKCLHDGISFQVCAAVKNRNLSVCDSDYQACVLMIPPLYLAKAIPATVNEPS
jgi:hypothetical protein